MGILCCPSIIIDLVQEGRVEFSLCVDRCGRLPSLSANGTVTFLTSFVWQRSPRCRDPAPLISRWRKSQNGRLDFFTGSRWLRWHRGVDCHGAVVDICGSSSNGLRCQHPCPASKNIALVVPSFCKFGIPAQIHTDGGKEFVNKLSNELFSLLNVNHTKTTPAHPQCNAQVEVFNKTVKKYLASFVDDTTLDWENFLPALMLSYNTSYHSTIATTPFELLFGEKPRLPCLR